MEISVFVYDNNNNKKKKATFLTAIDRQKKTN